ncbi:MULTISPECIES: hypothetical protein [Acidithiobacillus]|uniref:Conjugal transfer protein TrbC n=2 Tax=Acidithiobacillus TaxID=119977 RepID=A0A179BPT6_ACIFR|nr:MULTISPECIES: hypothetical protein [Acidithiobacillus]MEB8488132.1 hypothetical protein [Acidithiobacillus ferriphilus]MEB8488718.1 hypothetical protein [Acidithiobacillus ferriphilus]MEB8492162.1 hypothetical protein [Acidithiobacillus ferriphilus]MEB8513466.1 hypothetical protein [Acidithiobacillus ferriphilus]MEB8520361.1 hypothetical protein [Acidithiobacillus ferriphilus]
MSSAMNRAVLIVIMIMGMMAISTPAFAGTSTTTIVGNYSGQNAISTLEGILYGGWGLVIGIVMFFVAIGMFLKFGLGAAITTAIIGVVIFVVPALVHDAQQYGASKSGYTQTTG